MSIGAELPAKSATMILTLGYNRTKKRYVGTWIGSMMDHLWVYEGAVDVTGNKLTAGVLGLHWDERGIAPGAPAPGFGVVVDEVRKIAGETIDIGSVLEGVFGPGTVANKIQRAYDDLLFHGATLQKLPDTPRFVINATNVQSTVLWRFSKPYMRDWRVGEVRNPQIPLALAVAASSAFPPVLSPCEIDLKAYGCVFEPGSGVDLQMEPYISKAVLTDGGVYDNLGLETAWKQYKTILISDGGGHIGPEPKPHRDWARHSFRVLEIIDNQVRSLRVRQAIEQFRKGERAGGVLGYPDRHRGLRPRQLATLSARPDPGDRVRSYPAEEAGSGRPGAPHQLGLCGL